MCVDIRVDIRIDMCVDVCVQARGREGATPPLASSRQGSSNKHRLVYVDARHLTRIPKNHFIAERIPKNHFIAESLRTLTALGRVTCACGDLHMHRREAGTWLLHLKALR